MFDKILVPLDGSELAERALEPALTIARQRRGEAIIMRVPILQQVMMPGAAGYGYMLGDESLAAGSEECLAYLQDVQRRVGEPSLALCAKLVEGDVAGSIVDVAAKEKVDLIVMTTHGYSGLTRWMMGSVTERVLRSARCPVLVIRHATPLKEILITLDGSRLAEQALAPGLELACLLGERVTLLRVDHEDRLGALEMSLLEIAGTGLSKPIAGDVADRIGYYLDCMARKVQPPELALETVVVRGEPAASILDYAERNEIDLIVMATHGHTGLRRWIYGSVTHKVLCKADCAMLIVRPPDEALH
jgi:nucleotide-binding universal stress UspA family protein